MKTFLIEVEERDESILIKNVFIEKDFKLLKRLF